jgi:hypothetical protein
MDDLLQFLPALAQPGRSFVTGPLQYMPDVEAFFRRAGNGWWSDPDYEPAAAARMLADDEAVRRATLREVRAMLTCCVRGERFCDGYWEGILQAGRVTALLRRLAVLRQEAG